MRVLPAGLFGHTFPVFAHVGATQQVELSDGKHTGPWQNCVESNTLLRIKQEIPESASKFEQDLLQHVAVSQVSPLHGTVAGLSTVWPAGQMTGADAHVAGAPQQSSIVQVASAHSVVGANRGRFRPQL